PRPCGRPPRRGAPPPASATPEPALTPPLDLAIAAIARRLRDGSLTAGALWRDAAARHDRHGERLNAYIHWDAQQAEKQAVAADAAFAAGHDLGPLQGIPGSVKDLFALAGYPTYAGSPQRLPPAWEREGPVMRA